jgi:nitroreductase
MATVTPTPSTLPLTPDEVLATTRSVRKRLDLTRPVGRAVLEECLALAQQAPTPSNMQTWRFLVVTDPATRAALGALYRRGFELYKTLPLAATSLPFADPARRATQQRVMDSITYLAEHIHEVPVHVIGCIAPRPDGQPAYLRSALWGSIAPAAWSFMLAARARGLGTCWTCFHLVAEEEAADLLGIPYREVLQATLMPVAYTKGTAFKAAPRDPLPEMVRWERW